MPVVCGPESPQPNSLASVLCVACPFRFIARSRYTWLGQASTLALLVPGELSLQAIPSRLTRLLLALSIIARLVCKTRVCKGHAFWKFRQLGSPLRRDGLDQEAASSLSKRHHEPKQLELPVRGHPHNVRHGLCSIPSHILTWPAAPQVPCNSLCCRQQQDRRTSLLGGAAARPLFGCEVSSSGSKR